MKDYSLMLNTWEKRLIRHTSPHISLRATILSEKTKSLLCQVGLPLIEAEEAQGFLPFTFLHQLQVKSKKIYLLGDCSPDFMGTSFIGLEKGSEEIYGIGYNRDNELAYKFTNQSLYQFLQCLYYYNAFWQKYDGSSEVVPEEIKKDYEQLQLDLTQVDAQAMSQRDYFWKHRIEVMEVSGYGDYLTGRELPVMENPPTFTQDEIDNMDLPF